MVAPARRLCVAEHAIPTIAARRGTTTLDSLASRGRIAASPGAVPTPATACSTRRCDARAASAMARRPTRTVVSDLSGHGASIASRLGPVVGVSADSRTSPQATPRTREAKRASRADHPRVGNPRSASNRSRAGRACSERTNDPPGPSMTSGFVETWFIPITERVPRVAQLAGSIAGGPCWRRSCARSGPVTDAPRSKPMKPRCSARFRAPCTCFPMASATPNPPCELRTRCRVAPIAGPSEAFREPNRLGGRHYLAPLGSTGQVPNLQNRV